MLRQAALSFLMLAILAATTNAKWGKARAQLSGTLSESRHFSEHTPLTDLKPGPIKGFTLEHGSLKVKHPGVYYIYAQVFFETYPSAPTYHNRVALTVNGKTFALMQTGLGNQADYGSVYTGGVRWLKKDDKIGLKTVYDSRIWMSRAHTFVGGFRV